MPAQVVQTHSNHARMDPPFHYVLAPALIGLLVWTIVNLVRSPGSVTGSMVAVVLIMLLIALKARQYATKVQDRVIRLEERLRLNNALPEPLRARIPQMIEHQLIALRFAPDAELAGLVERTLRENLGGKQIKDSIQNWRGDYWRV